MPAYEIDDIFAGKIKNVMSATRTKDKGKQKAASLGTAVVPAATKNKKKRKHSDDNDGGESANVNGTLSAHDAANPSTEEEPSIKKKKKRKDRRNRGEADGADATTREAKTTDPGFLKSTRIVETVYDPSAARLGPSSKTPSDTTIPLMSTNSAKSKLGTPKAETKTKRAEENDEGLKRFKDSRGSGPRKRTEEGWIVYKEDELGIDKEGGNTPLCPFDCDCCF